MKVEPISVTQLNKYVKDKIATDDFLNNVFVKGEISNCKHHYTGHIYFTLKDEESLIKCIMFKSNTINLTFVPKDGMKVNILGTVAVYERDGIYQIYCKAMQEDGIGTLYEKYEKLKLKLEKKGYFDKKFKQNIPFFPTSIAVLTSQTGSVIKDIINVATRRNPNVYIKLLPVPVQGEGASEKIANAINIINNNNISDIIILARGGGSLEDLWPFNEELVAEAIFNSKIPIISAVGHETDFSISDFVADLRAPTPSAAAELAVPDISELYFKIQLLKNRNKLALKKRVDLLKLRYVNCMKSTCFTNPTQRINENYIKVDMQVKKLDGSINKKLLETKNKAIKLFSKLDTLSPLKTLTRGYCITEYDNKIIKLAKDLKKDMEINLKFQDGNKKAKII